MAPHSWNRGRGAYTPPKPKPKRKRYPSWFGNSGPFGPGGSHPSAPNSSNPWAGTPGLPKTTLGGNPPFSNPQSQATPPPLDALYEDRMAFLKNRLGRDLNEIDSDERTAGLTYGFRATKDAAGNVTGMEVDPTDPFSRLQLLRDLYHQRRGTFKNQMAGQGQLYSGALMRGMEGEQPGSLRYQEDSDYDSLSKDFMELMKSLAERRRGAHDEYGEGVYGAEGDKAARAVDLRTEDPGTGSAPKATSKATSKRTHPTKTKSHVAAGLKRVGKNVYKGPNGTFWHRTKNGTFARGRG